MVMTNLTALADVMTKVTIYEPRQSPEQPEVVLDEVELTPGEVRPYELRSATAAFRIEPSHGPLPEDFGKPLPDQEPFDGLAPTTSDELTAGGERLSLAEESRVKTKEARERDTQRRAATAPPRTGREDMPRAEPARKGKGSHAEAHRKRQEERAAEKTKGQEHDEAVNPSAQTGSTGHADVQAEVGAAGSEGAVGEAAVERNKAPDARSP